MDSEPELGRRRFPAVIAPAVPGAKLIDWQLLDAELELLDVEVTNVMCGW